VCDEDILGHDLAGRTTVYVGGSREARFGQVHDSVDGSRDPTRA
jgi:hypothetical protein